MVMLTDAGAPQLKWMDDPSRSYRTEAEWEPLKPFILELSNQGYNAVEIHSMLSSGEVAGLGFDPNLKPSDVRRILTKWGKKTNINQKQRFFMHQTKAKKEALGKHPPEFRYKGTQERIDSQKIEASLQRNKRKDFSSSKSVLSVGSTECGISVVTSRVSSAKMSSLSSSVHTQSRIQSRWSQFRHTVGGNTNLGVLLEPEYPNPPSPDLYRVATVGSSVRYPVEEYLDVDEISNSSLPSSRSPQSFGTQYSTPPSSSDSRYGGVEEYEPSDILNYYGAWPQFQEDYSNSGDYDLSLYGYNYNNPNRGTNGRSHLSQSPLVFPNEYYPEQGSDMADPDFADASMSLNDLNGVASPHFQPANLHPLDGMMEGETDEGIPSPGQHMLDTMTFMSRKIEFRNARRKAYAFRASGSGFCPNDISLVAFVSCFWRDLGNLINVSEPELKIRDTTPWTSVLNDLFTYNDIFGTDEQCFVKVGTLPSFTSYTKETERQERCPIGIETTAHVIRRSYSSQEFGGMVEMILKIENLPVVRTNMHTYDPRLFSGSSLENKRFIGFSVSQRERVYHNCIEVETAAHVFSLDSSRNEIYDGEYSFSASYYIPKDEIEDYPSTLDQTDAMGEAKEAGKLVDDSDVDMLNVDSGVGEWTSMGTFHHKDGRVMFFNLSEKENLGMEDWERTE
ncbi:hypothetical protein H072_5198 [Dactylellina haptotyla CBS 200.50]|uniref:Uncharacterized protein n=1 Tax=Dactylellina haptotyla (strain CBS 200.50) TaxID=1284197 RepID=S8BN97_DACHA|nr:hypothetical protein H072_5198 [Dactylellina haptotyla CBS 200.50]